MEEETLLTNLETVRFELAAQPKCFGQESQSESDEVERKEDVRCGFELCLIAGKSTEIDKREAPKCEECGKEFKTEFWLKKHSQKHGSKVTFVCDLCGKIFKRNSTLRAHCKEIHSLTKRYSCVHCGYASNNKANYETHVTVKHLDVNERGIKCDLCEKKYFRKEDIMRHKIKEHNAPRFKCDSCDNSYTSRQYLLIHKATHKPGFKPEHQCVQCGKLFPTGGRLSSHMRIRHSALQFQCQECGKYVSSPTCLRNHMTQHSGDKRYKCNACGKAFATRKYLSVHTRTHSGHKPYSCEACDKSFTQKSSLSIHIRRFHVNTKPFTCKVCLKGFVTSTLLKTHMKGHKTVIIENVSSS